MSLQPTFHHFLKLRPYIVTKYYLDIILVIISHPYTIIKCFQDWSPLAFGKEDSETVQMASCGWRAGITLDTLGLGVDRACEEPNLSFWFCNRSSWFVLGPTWTCSVWGASAWAVGLRDSKEGYPPTTCSSLHCATCNPPFLRLLSGEQRCLVFSGPCWHLLVALFQILNLNSTRYIFIVTYWYWIFPLLMLQVLYACFH